MAQRGSGGSAPIEETRPGDARPPGGKGRWTTMKNQFLTIPAAIASLSIGVAGLAGCETATPYQPAATAAATGYREIQIEPGRWRVTFAGNELTSRDTVETYLLYRSAELTARAGFTWFEAVARDTDTKKTTFIQRSGAVQGYTLVWRPYWRYRPHGWFGVWRPWNPWGTGQFFDVRTVTAYDASADIVMGRGEQPAGPYVFNARAVMQSLAPVVVRPK